MTAMLMATGTVFFVGDYEMGQRIIHSERNFYGVVRVERVGQIVLPDSVEALRDRTFAHAGAPTRPIYAMLHGRTRHGFQVAGRPDIPTDYFTPSSGVGLALQHHRGRSAGPADRVPMRVGVLGLGVGAIAAYAETGDRFRFYEIDQAIIDLAADSTYFSFIPDCRGTVDIVHGDARTMLRHELGQSGSNAFDLLILDAFSGDTPPTHLLTLEAFELYLKHLRGDGLLAVNITSKYFDWRPLIERQAQALGLHTATYAHPGDMSTELASASAWVILSPQPVPIDRLRRLRNPLPPSNRSDQVRPWTDNYSNPLQLLIVAGRTPFFNVLACVTRHD